MVEMFPVREEERCRYKSCYSRTRQEWNVSECVEKVGELDEPVDLGALGHFASMV
jgi:hypothetical protein